MHEPMTVLTDLLLTGWCGYLGARLLAGGAGRAQRWWGTAFCASAVAALCGGLWHALAPQLAAPLAALLWSATLWAIGFASAGFLLAAARATLSPRPARWLRWIALGKLLLYLLWSLGRDDFLPALLDYAPTLLLVLLLFAWRYRQTRLAAAPWVCAGIFTAFAAATVQAARLAPHPAFNHNDLYHLLQLLAFWLLFRGGRLLRDQK